MAEQRTRKADYPCPRCGAEMYVVEHAHMGTANMVLKWERLGRHCPQGCVLTAADFPEEE